MMREELTFEAEPFEGYTKFDEFELPMPELFEGEASYEWTGEVGRKSVGTDCGRAGAQAASVSKPGGRCTGPQPPLCPLVPGILSLKDIGGIPFEYVQSVGKDPSTKLVVVKQRFRSHTQRFLPPVQAALTQFIANMNRFGMAVEALLTAGSYCCRCVSKTNTLSNHSHGDAFDLVGVRWASSGGRETIVHNWNTAERPVLRRIDACLRLSFATVIDYHRSDHRDHFHCDTNRGHSPNLRSPESLRFTQEALSLVLNRSLAITGKFDAATQKALVEFAGGNKDVLKDSAQLNQILYQLFTRIASTPVNTAQPVAQPSVSQELGGSWQPWQAPRLSTVPQVSPCEDPAKNPPGLTLCERIPLGAGDSAPPVTSIFFPAGYKLQRNVDMIIYLHGDKLASGVSESATIADFWKRPEFRLREGLNASGKKAILVAPTLSPRSSSTKLMDKNFGLDWYLDQIMKVITTRGPYKGASLPRYVGTIILACHSGGGKVMRELALMTNHRYANNILEMWGFDCLYNPNDPASWRTAMTDLNATLYIYYLNSTAVNSLNLAGKGSPPIPPPENIKVERSSAASHGLVPATHWIDRLQRADYLRDE